MTTFPANTPVVVREGLTRYLRTCRCIAGLTWFAAGLAVALFGRLGGLLLDRFVECAPAWRTGTLWFAGSAAVAGVAIGLRAFLRAMPGFPAAVRLDQALPRNEDRWATVLDLLARQAAGQPVGDIANFTRLLQETENLTSAAPVDRLVSRRGFLVAVLALGLSAVVLGFLHISPAFDMPLLWNRLLHPHDNWPRDGFTVIRVLDVNGRRLAPGAALLPAIPEESAFAIKVAVAERPHTWWPWPAAVARREQASAGMPRLEHLRPGGRIETQEFIATGDAWLLSRPLLTEPCVFRIRAGDALSEVVTQPVLERIRIQSVEHAVRFPVYSRLPARKRCALDADAPLTLLEGAGVEFFLTCNSGVRQFTATFDLLPRKPAPGAPSPAPAAADPVTGETVRRDSPTPATPAAQRRVLKVTRTGTDRARFGLLADESGILRIDAVGTNGLAARGRTVVVEAIQDAPPRITISGLDPDTKVVPGELVGLEYAAEDDLGVADLVMEWTVAGGAQFEHLTGEEYIQNPALGQKLVSGKQTIQRMNYYVYAQVPLEFRLVATDTKGQEARSEKFRIHLVRDDFTTRFDTGMALLTELADILQSRASGLQNGLNQLNIMATALKGAERWPADGQEKMLRDLEDALGSRQYNPFHLNILRAKHEYGDLPCRIQESLSLLLAAERLLPGIPENVAAARRLPATPGPAVAVEGFRANLTAQKEFVAVLRAAALAEFARFRIEQCCQVAMKLANRLDLLASLPGDQNVFAANLENYAAQTVNLAKNCDEFRTRVPETVTVLERTRAAVAAPLEIAKLEGALHDLAAVLADAPAPVSAELTALPAAMSAAAGRDAHGSERLPAALAMFLKHAADSQLPQPLRVLQFNRWLSALPAQWTTAVRSPADVWFAACELRHQVASHQADLLADRFALEPARRQDAEAELREYALALRDLAAAAELPVSPALAMSPAAPGDRVQRLRQAVEVLIAVAEPKAQVQWVQESALRGRDMADLATRLDTLAVRYEALVPGIQAALPLVVPPPVPTTVAAAAAAAAAAYAANPASVIQPQRSEAVRLQLACEAAEAAYRNLFRLRLLADLRLIPAGAPPPTPMTWPELRTLHGVQLALTLLASNGRERVAFRLLAEDKDSRRWKAALTGIQETAKLCRDIAGTLRSSDLAQPGPLDLAAVMRETRTTGYLDTLDADYQQLEPALRGRPAGAQEALLVKTRTSRLGRMVAAEQLLVPALALQAALKTPENAVPKPLLERVHALQAALAAQPGQAVPETLAPFAKRLAGVAGEAVMPANLQPTVKEFGKALDKELDAWRAAAQFPARRRGARQNQHDHEMQELGIWVIADTVENHDVRWQARVQSAELGLARAILAPSPQTATVAADYVRLIEMRARQFSGEQRRNQGFSLLEADGGPGLKLPKHIAAEFLRARNRRPPEQFKAWSEAYYEALYRAAKP